MELGDGGDGNDWFFLAMAHWQLGHQEEARKWFDQAAEWMKNRPADATLNRFRAEATQLIGVAHSASSTIPPREANESQNANIPESTVSSAPDK
jgi:hypothetical protein